jgi:hypothetical protein
LGTFLGPFRALLTGVIRTRLETSRPAELDTTDHRRTAGVVRVPCAIRALTVHPGVTLAAMTGTGEVGGR